jgi:hypothetical protein
MRWGPRTRAIGVGLMFLAMIFIGLSSSSEISKADTVANPAMIFLIPCNASAYIDSNNPATAFPALPDYPLMDVGRFVATPEQYQRSYWQFDVGSLPENLAIDKVTGYFFLDTIENLNLSRGWDGFTMGVYSVGAGWDETTLTWNTAPAVNWATDTVQLTQFPRLSPFNAYNSTNPYQDFYSWQSIDLTTVGQAWYADNTTDHGVFFSLEYMTSTQDVRMYWVARNQGAWNLDSPYLEVIAHSKEVQVHLSYYDSFTGEGLAPWMFNVSASLNGSAFYRITPEITTSLYNENLTIVVKDFFGNGLYNETRAVQTSIYFWDIGLPVYSWQIFNMNDAPVLMRIYWNNSGSPWEFFVGPHWIIERFLKGGNYTFMVTFYESTGVAGATVYYNRTMPMTGLNASFVYVNGTTLSEIVSSIEGVMAVQLIITNLVSPSMVLIYENLPLAPVQIRTLSMSTRIAIDPYLILEATTYQNQTGVAGVNTVLWLPHAQTVGSSYYVLADTLTFSGTFATTIYVNDTAGTNIYYNTILPAAIQLGGENITVWANQPYSVSRATTWREISEYTVNYYSTQRKYEATISLNNSCPFDYYSPYWYIAFPQNTTIDPDTVTLYDLDNNLYLAQRTNFEVTAGGLHVTLVRLNASDARNFRVTYWDANGSSGIGAPNLIAEAFTQGTLNSVSMKYTSVQWTNPYSVEYRGEVYITLNFSEGDSLLRNSIVIIDETTGNSIPNSQWVYTGRTILILTDGVGTVQVGGARNYGIYFTFDAEKVPEKTDMFFGPIVWNGQQFWLAGYAISWALILIIFGWIIVAWRFWTDERHHDAFSFAIIWGSVTIIMAYFSMVM